MHYEGITVILHCQLAITYLGFREAVYSQDWYLSPTV